MNRQFLVVLLLSFPAIASAREMYRAPSAGDSGKYYVLSHEKESDGTVRVLSSRVGKGNAYTDFTELKINCEARQYFELAGTSEDGAQEKPSKPLRDWSGRSKWTSLVPGSSKSDLVGFVCNKYKLGGA